MAVSATCVHQGCTEQPQASFRVEPAHLLVHTWALQPKHTLQGAVPGAWILCCCCCCCVASVVSNSVRPHRRQPTRLPRPWDSPGKNTGVGCHFLLRCMKVKSESQVAQSCLTLRDPMDCSLQGSSVHGIFQARVLEWGAIAFSTGFSRAPSYLFYICRSPS